MRHDHCAHGALLTEGCDDCGPVSAPASIQPAAAAQRAYRDRWCDHCKTTHRYFTGWTTNGRNEHDQLSDMQTEQHCLPEALSTMATKSHAATEAQCNSTQAGQAEETRAMTPTTPTPGEAAREHREALQWAVNFFRNVDSAGCSRQDCERGREVAEILSRHFPPTEATEPQTWCDHCSADLSEVKHVLCECCYREYAGPKLTNPAFDAEATQVAVEVATSEIMEHFSGIDIDALPQRSTITAIISKHCTADAGEVERLKSDRDSWRRVAEWLESEKLTARANAIAECLMKVSRVSVFTEQEDRLIQITAVDYKVSVIDALESLAKKEGDDAKSGRDT